MFSYPPIRTSGFLARNYYYIIRYYSNNTLCQVHVTMGEFGVYDVNLDSTDAGRIDCRFSTAKEPVDIYARKPILYYYYYYHIKKLEIFIALT